ncbi:hypothetical protein J3R80_08775 [Aliiroseovarius sp. Z3]|uniref:hypothetical protein n=1 Tax=Aliiroseovarius sp. Z3 TaxID=2811402 RepID=UPI0023B20BB3|nr:hypothetical protein [Aliiroseovarius sp. Z3]MDE9450558.1 hypothetical protein [Aliiroseovarius sp. Z3]
MSVSLPEYYFRVRENGAFVFRVNTDNRQRPLELDQIAAVNIRNGEVKPHGEYVLTDADHAAISEWMEQRRATLQTRDLDDILRSVDHLNMTAHWAQTRATPEALEQVTDALLLAMHDLRAVLVRKKADRLKQS